MGEPGREMQALMGLGNGWPCLYAVEAVDA